MLSSVIRFVRLPLLLLVLWTAIRFTLGVSGVPYTPRGNAMISVFGLTIISCIYYGALSVRVGSFSWLGTLSTGATIALWGQVLIFIATLISYLGGFDNSYFVHWDALNVAEGTAVPMAKGMMTRAGGFIAGPILGAVAAAIGRLLHGLAPQPAKA
ncbi:MAG: hypothetical protein AAB354_07980 [candidate division KSB1 bacterium]